MKRRNDNQKYWDCLRSRKNPRKMLTVAELIQSLQQLDQDKYILMELYDYTVVGSPIVYWIDEYGNYVM